MQIILNCLVNGYSVGTVPVDVTLRKEPIWGLRSYPSFKGYVFCAECVDIFLSKFEYTDYNEWNATFEYNDDGNMYTYILNDEMIYNVIDNMDLKALFGDKKKVVMLDYNIPLDSF